MRGPTGNTLGNRQLGIRTSAKGNLAPSALTKNECGCPISRVCSARSGAFSFSRECLRVRLSSQKQPCHPQRYQGALTMHPHDRSPRLCFSPCLCASVVGYCLPRQNRPTPTRTCTVFSPGFGVASPAFEICKYRNSTLQLYFAPRTCVPKAAAEVKFTVFV
jgi:hypothetical protein